jgi:asparagine synthase (glutamine-hydrolysing)
LIANHKGKVEAKVALKDLCASQFGESFAYRDKMGFGIPLRSFMSDPVFQEKWKNEIEPNMQRRGIFNTNEISKWVQNIKQATSDQLDAIWLMVSFELWAKQYLD